MSALSAINTSLPRVYRALTGAPSCDAHCSYSEAQMFEEGVALVVRPPGARWRAFAALSGGQQALAALALSFALQAQLPSPFYFFDECDACERLRVHGGNPKPTGSASIVWSLGMLPEPRYAPRTQAFVEHSPCRCCLQEWIARLE